MYKYIHSDYNECVREIYLFKATYITAEDLCTGVHLYQDPAFLLSFGCEVQPSFHCFSPVQDIVLKPVHTKNDNIHTKA